MIFTNIVKSPDDIRTAQILAVFEDSVLYIRLDLPWHFVRGVQSHPRRFRISAEEFFHRYPVRVS